MMAKPRVLMLLAVACVAASGSTALTAPDLAGFVDASVGEQLARRKIAGAVVVVTYRGVRIRRAPIS